MSYILSLDQGTTSSRAMIFDRAAREKAVARKEFTQIFPRPGWVEHDPQEIWSSQVAVLEEVMAKAKIGPKDLAGVGITNQRETTILWDRKSGVPVSNAIVWQDRRTAQHCERLRKHGHSTSIRNKTGLVIDAYFSATKVSWILDNIPDARNRANRGELAFGTVDSWLIYNLTKGNLHVTDTTNASRTLLFNIHDQMWDEDLLKIFQIPRSLLPQVRSSSEIYGTVEADLSIRGAVISGVAGDQQAATFGQACFEPGLAKNTYGTGCFLLMNTGSCAQESKNNLLTTLAWKREGEITYALEGGVFVGGAIVQWLRDGLKIIRTSAEIEPLAASVPDTGGVFFVPALAGLGAPHWDPFARGTIVGITRGTSHAHIARAALAGITFEVADLVRSLESDAEMGIHELRVDGGASGNNLLMQLQADVLQIPVVRPTNRETTALGAAYLAGLAVGFWKSLSEVGSKWVMDQRFEPKISESEATAVMERWQDAVDRSRGWDR